VKFPQIETKRLLLCELNNSDDHDVFELFSDPLVVEYYDLSEFLSIEQAQQLISLFHSRYENGIGIRWAIRLKGDNELIGTCGFNSWSENMKSASIGYDLKSPFWGNGYAQEAVRSIIVPAFEGGLACGALNRIQADTVPGNFASENLLVKLGFVEEGLRREAGHWKSKFYDLKCFGLLKSEFKA